MCPFKVGLQSANKHNGDKEQKKAVGHTYTKSTDEIFASGSLLFYASEGQMKHFASSGVNSQLGFVWGSTLTSKVAAITAHTSAKESPLVH